MLRAGETQVLGVELGWHPLEQVFARRNLYLGDFHSRRFHPYSGIPNVGPDLLRAALTGLLGAFFTLLFCHSVEPKRTEDVVVSVLREAEPKRKAD